jgi:hypothetical protein
MNVISSSLTFTLFVVPCILDQKDPAFELFQHSGTASGDSQATSSAVAVISHRLHSNFRNSATMKALLAVLASVIRPSHIGQSGIRFFA